VRKAKRTEICVFQFLEEPVLGGGQQRKCRGGRGAKCNSLFKKVGRCFDEEPRPIPSPDRVHGCDRAGRATRWIVTIRIELRSFCFKIACGVTSIEAIDQRTAAIRAVFFPGSPNTDHDSATSHQSLTPASCRLFFAANGRIDVWPQNPPAGCRRYVRQSPVIPNPQRQPFSIGFSSHD